MLTPRSRCFGLLLLLGLCLGLGTSACHTSPSYSRQPLPEPAVLAFTEARRLWEDERDPRDGRLWAVLEQAREGAPEWVAPQRLEDDLLLAAGLGIEALERRRNQALADPESARARYLVARLEGERVPDAFEAVLRMDPDFAWGRYAHAFVQSVNGGRSARRRGGFLGDWQRAVEQARTPWEAAYFGRGLGRYLARVKRPDQALALLGTLIRELKLDGRDRAWLQSELAQLELEHPNSDERRRGYERGLSLLSGGQLAEQEIPALVASMEEGRVYGDPTLYRLELALGGEQSQIRSRLEADRWLQRGELQLAERLLVDDESAAARSLRELAQSPKGLFRQRRFFEAMQAWLQRQPTQVLDNDGLPSNLGLRAVLEQSRALQGELHAAGDLAAFGDALLAIGWYAEAQIVASALRVEDPLGSRRLRRQALAGRVLLFDLERSLRAVQQDQPDYASEVDPKRPKDSKRGSLDDLLRRWGRAFADCANVQGRATLATSLGEIFVDSPRMNYGPFAELLHPGPWFSQADEDLGLGRAGEPVPGLALLMARHNRFAVVGQTLFGAPDASVLRRNHVELRRGEHLGTPWSGTVVWCEGADVLSSAQTAGADVGGAALHEGYWIDLDQLRAPFERWRKPALELGALGAETLGKILRAPGLRLRTPASQSRERQRERRSIRFPLGQAERLRLAVLMERAPAGQLLGELPFSEFVGLIATHEEGHLCDRTRFLPLSRHIGAWLGFALDNGFSARAIQQRLEYRAQLVALCSIPDPRLALVDLLEAAAATQDSGLGHGPAYRDLLSDLIAELDGRLLQDPSRYPRLSLDHSLMHQLHLVSPEELRALGTRVAEGEGLVGR